MYIKSFKNFIRYFGKGRKVKLFLFSVMAIIAGAFEFVGVALIYPFILAMIKPEVMLVKIKYLPEFIQLSLSNMNASKLALSIGFFALAIFVIKNIYMVAFVYFQSRFLAHWTAHISRLLMRFYLFAPYKTIQKISKSEKLYVLGTLSNQATNGFCARFITLITNVVIVMSILILILSKFLFAGLFSLGFVIVSVIIQNKLFKSKLTFINSIIINITRKLNDVVFSNINCIKEVKIQNVENKFYYKYASALNKVIKITSNRNFYSSVSPYIVETLIVATLIMLCVFIVKNNNGTETLIASLALIAAAIFRIAPALNRIQNSLLNLPTAHKFLQELLAFYENNDVAKYVTELKEKPIIDFENSLEFKNINFSYEPNKPILSDISFKINKGDFVGIIGLSGVGKSTLADVITGLLQKDSGEIYVDGRRVTSEEYVGFRKNIGYVQQDFNVLECSFRENIAWSEEPNEIDDDLVVRLLKDVHLYEVVSEYKDGIYSVPFVGESGLSKGQKQRLAIARALYRNPKILLFDEATSALDVKVEHEITEMLRSVAKGKTIIAIAHRLSTLQACNKLIYMKDGRIVDIGTFKELAEKYTDFAELVKFSSLKNVE